VNPHPPQEDQKSNPEKKTNDMQPSLVYTPEPTAKDGHHQQDKNKRKQPHHNKQRERKIAAEVPSVDEFKCYKGKHQDHADNSRYTNGGGEAFHKLKTSLLINILRKLYLFYEESKCIHLSFVTTRVDYSKYFCTCESLVIISNDLALTWAIITCQMDLDDEKARLAAFANLQSQIQVSYQ